jgi:riboflavin kinase/FMN adenylyltransferase|tara:strand:- start:83 stop:1015 length:933 start_codon:yes stop_codon:yes gene_type:complete
MKVYNSIAAYKKTKPSIVTIGTFDGVHVGHQQILKQLYKTAHANELESILVSFFPHPRMVLQKESSLKLLNTIEERTRMIEKTGISNLIVQPFTKEFSRLSALDFVRDILVNQLHIKKIIVGYDHQFGRNRNATIDDLIEFGKTYDFEVIEISAQQLENVSISSTKIRNALNEGAVQTANTYLGYPFMISGLIVKGKGIGKTLEFPTANLHLKEDYKLIPKNGVYLVQSIISGKEVFGLTNIGTNPTVGGTYKTIETYFLDYSRDLYQKEIQLNFIKRIRGEKTFESKDALKNAITKDEQFARNYLNNNE